MENVYLLPNTAPVRTIKAWFYRMGIFCDISKVTLNGYRAYFVEQWVATREPCSLIVTYTGDDADELETIQLCIREVSSKTTWPQEFLDYLVFQQSHSTPTQTDQGIIFITDLVGLDSDLLFIGCPSKDIKANYLLYVMNYNLKILGCSARSATTISIPSSTVADKFKSMFHTPDNVPIDYVATQLIAICQTCLFYFNKIALSNCDGLICNNTLAAIDDWWNTMNKIEYSSLLFKQRGPFCPINVSIMSIIGFTLLCRSTLELGGNAFYPPKDITEVERMISVILMFQKHFKLQNTGYFNEETVNHLIKWAQTSKSSTPFSKDLSKMKNIVKSTVSDFKSGSKIQQKKLGFNENQNKSMNCQDLNQIRTLSLSKKMDYLFKGKGESYDFIDALSRYSIKKINKSKPLTSLDSATTVKSKSNKGSLSNNVMLNIQQQLEDDWYHEHSIGLEDHNKESSAPPTTTPPNNDHDNQLESENEFDHVEGFDYDHDIDGPAGNILGAVSHSADTFYTDSNVPSQQNLKLNAHELQQNTAISNNVIFCSDECQKSHDMEYQQFQKRLNRRNSIPLVRPEMNLNSIEPLKYFSNNSNLGRKNSGRHHYQDHLSLYSRNDEFSDNTSYLSTNHIVKRQAWITYQSETMYETEIVNRDLRRVVSLPSLVNIDTYKEETRGLVTTTANYLTPDAIALKYLRLKEQYQLEFIQKMSIWKREAKFFKEDILFNSETKWIEQFKDNIESPHDSSFHSIALTRGGMSMSKVSSMNIYSGISPKNTDYFKVVSKYTEMKKKYANKTESNNRLRYELQTLLRKTNEVESSVAQLRDLKMKKLNDKIHQLCKKLNSNEFEQKINDKIKNANAPAERDNMLGKVCNSNGKVDWSQLEWKVIFFRPYILVYLFFRWLGSFFLYQYNNEFIKQNWKQIDKNNTVTNVFRDLYDKGEMMFKSKPEKAHKND